MAAGRFTASKVGHTTSSNFSAESPNPMSQTWVLRSSVSGRVKGVARAAWITTSRTRALSTP